MKKDHLRTVMSMILVICMCIFVMPRNVVASESEQRQENTVDLEHVIAGVAGLDSVVGALSEDTVPEIIGYESAIAQNHIVRLYDDEGDNLNKVVFLNTDGSKTMYTFDFPVKYVDAQGCIQDISLAIADSDGEQARFETKANSAVTTFAPPFV